MFDPFEMGRQQDAVSTVDYRNGKYQGFLGKQGQRQGLGMILDHHYLLTLASWKQNQVEGPVFLVFPDSSLFWGEVIGGLPWGIGTFQTSAGHRIYSLFRSKGTNLFVFEDSYNKGLQQVSIENSLIMQRGGTETKEYLAECFQEQSKGIQVGPEVKYREDGEKQKKLSELLGQKIPLTQLNYQTFIVDNFKEQAKLEIEQTKNEFSFKFPASSLVCRLGNAQNASFPKLMGYFNSITKLMEISKKDLRNGKVQESISNQSLTHHAQQRPPECLNALHLYYRQSLHFANQYLSIDYLYRVQFIFHSLMTLQTEIIAHSQGQTLIKVIAESNVTTQRSKVSTHYFQNKRCTLDEVKQDIYKAVKAKSHSSSFAHSYIQSRSSPIKSHKKVPLSHNKSFSHYQKTTPIKSAPQKKTTTPHDYSRIAPQNYSKISTPPRNVQKGTVEQTKIKTKSPLSKYAYLEQSRYINSKRMENINNLTQYYEAIQNDLRKESTKQKQLFSPYVQPSLYSAESSAKKGSPIGPKKTLQYGWK